MKNWLNIVGLLGLTGSVGFAVAELTPALPTETAPQETAATLPAPASALPAQSSDQELITESPALAEATPTAPEITDAPKAELVKKATGTGGEVKEYKEVLEPIAEGPASPTSGTSSGFPFGGAGAFRQPAVLAPELPPQDANTSN